MRGNTVTTHGQVNEVDRSGPETIVTIEVWTDDDTGARLAPGTAKVAIPN